MATITAVRCDQRACDTDSSRERCPRIPAALLPGHNVTRQWTPGYNPLGRLVLSYPPKGIQMRAVKVVVTVALMVAVTPEASAQVGVGLGVGSGIGQIGTGAWLRESRLAPSMRFDAPAGFVRLDASALERSGSLSLERAALDGAASTPAFGPLRFTFTGQFRDARFDTAQISSVGSALSLKHRGSGVWIGTVHDRAAVAQYQLGAWQVLRSAIFSLTTNTRASTMTERTRYLRVDSFYTDTTGWQKHGVWVDRVNMTRSRRWSDVQAR